MRARALTAVGTVFILFSAADVLAQTKPTKVDTVSLRFGWPAGLSARVEAEQYRVREADATDTVAMTLSYRMRVSAAPTRDLLISYDDFAFPKAAAPGGAANMQSIMEQLAVLSPNLRVNRAGEFVSIEGIAQLRARLDSMLRPMLEQDPSGQARTLVQSMLSEETLNALAAQEWNGLVGMWIGADLELGEVYALEEEAPIPFLAGATVKMVSEFLIEERLPCEEGSSTQDCVLIRLVSEPDPDEMKKILAAFMERVTGEAAQQTPVFEELHLSNEIELVVRPESLIPYTFLRIKAVEGTVRVGAERSSFSQVDERSYTYRYDKK